MTHPLTFELSPIKAMELAAAKRPGSISLAQGIPSFPTPEAIKAFVTEKIKGGYCDKYSLTIGLSELREEIAHALSQEGCPYDPDSEILATAGSIEGITASIFANTSPGDEVILPSPSYVSYQGAIAMARCKAVFAPLAEDQNFDFDLQAIERALTPRTRIILYCSPNNPTGTLFSEEKTRQLVKLAEKQNIMLLADEVYKDFYYGDEKHFSATHIPEARKRIIRVCSFSKAYAMTGWRIGFVHADKDVLRGIIKYHDAMVTCAPVVSQYAAIAALRFGNAYLDDFRREFRERRDYAIGVLDSLSHVLDYQLPRATYFVFPRIKDTVPLANNSHKLAYDILDKTGLALVPGSAFGPSGESHLRINFGRSKEDLEEGLERLKGYFSQGSKRAAQPVISASSSRKHGVLKGAALKLLALSAKLYLARTKPIIVGIAGLRGKTVYKRYFHELLSREKSVRANLLSYNTKVGLPLSILDLENPLKTKSLTKFFFRLGKRLIYPAKEKEILILEYGISNPSDSEHLMAIKKPDWLVLTNLATGDASFNHQEVAQGVALLAKSIEKERVIWNFDDDILRDQPITLDDSLSISLQNVESEDTRNLISKALNGNKVVGDSANKALLSGCILALKLGLSEDSINGYLNEIS